MWRAYHRHRSAAVSFLLSAAVLHVLCLPRYADAISVGDLLCFPSPASQSVLSFPELGSLSPSLSLDFLPGCLSLAAPAAASSSSSLSSLSSCDSACNCTACTEACQEVIPPSVILASAELLYQNMQNITDQVCLSLLETQLTSWAAYITLRYRELPPVFNWTAAPGFTPAIAPNSSLLFPSFVVPNISSMVPPTDALRNLTLSILFGSSFRIRAMLSAFSPFSGVVTSTSFQSDWVLSQPVYSYLFFHEVEFAFAVASLYDLPPSFFRDDSSGAMGGSWLVGANSSLPLLLQSAPEMQCVQSARNLSEIVLCRWLAVRRLSLFLETNLTAAAATLAPQSDSAVAAAVPIFDGRDESLSQFILGVPRLGLLSSIVPTSSTTTTATAATTTAAAAGAGGATTLLLFTDTVAVAASPLAYNYSNIQQASDSSVICSLAGYFTSGNLSNVTSSSGSQSGIGTVCLPCPAGFFCPGDGLAHVCSNGPSDALYAASIPAASGASQNTCPWVCSRADTFRVNDTCAPIPAGLFSPNGSFELFPCNDTAYGTAPSPLAALWPPTVARDWTTSGNRSATGCRWSSSFDMILPAAASTVPLQQLYAALQTRLFLELDLTFVPESLPLSPSSGFASGSHQQAYALVDIWNVLAVYLMAPSNLSASTSASVGGISSSNSNSSSGFIDHVFLFRVAYAFEMPVSMRLPANLSTAVSVHMQWMLSNYEKNCSVVLSLVAPGTDVAPGPASQNTSWYDFGSAMATGMQSSTWTVNSTTNQTSSSSSGGGTAPFFSFYSRKAVNTSFPYMNISRDFYPLDISQANITHVAIYQMYPPPMAATEAMPAVISVFSPLSCASNSSFQAWANVSLFSMFLEVDMSSNRSGDSFPSMAAAGGDLASLLAVGVQFWDAWDRPVGALNETSLSVCRLASRRLSLQLRSNMTALIGASSTVSYFVVQVFLNGSSLQTGVSFSFSLDTVQIRLDGYLVYASTSSLFLGSAPASVSGLAGSATTSTATMWVDRSSLGDGARIRYPAAGLVCVPCPNEASMVSSSADNSSAMLAPPLLLGRSQCPTAVSSNNNFISGNLTFALDPPLSSAGWLPMAETVHLLVENCTLLFQGSAVSSAGSNVSLLAVDVVPPTTSGNGSAGAPSCWVDFAANSSAPGNATVAFRMMSDASVCAVVVSFRVDLRATMNQSIDARTETLLFFFAPRLPLPQVFPGPSEYLCSTGETNVTARVFGGIFPSSVNASRFLYLSVFRWDFSGGDASLLTDAAIAAWEDWMIEVLAPCLAVASGGGTNSSIVKVRMDSSSYYPSDYLSLGYFYGSSVGFNSTGNSANLTPGAGSANASATAVGGSKDFWIEVGAYCSGGATSGGWLVCMSCPVFLLLIFSAYALEMFLRRRQQQRSTKAGLRQPTQRPSRVTMLPSLSWISQQQQPRGNETSGASMVAVPSAGLSPAMHEGADPAPHIVTMTVEEGENSEVDTPLPASQPAVQPSMVALPDAQGLAFERLSVHFGHVSLPVEDSLDVEQVPAAASVGCSAEGLGEIILPFLEEGGVGCSERETFESLSLASPLPTTSETEEMGVVWTCCRCGKPAKWFCRGACCRADYCSFHKKLHELESQSSTRRTHDWLQITGACRVCGKLEAAEGASWPFAVGGSGSSCCRDCLAFYHKEEL